MRQQTNQRQTPESNKQIYNRIPSKTRSGLKKRNDIDKHMGN